MSEHPKDGGPAFPTTGETDAYGENIHVFHPGMSLRDYAAIHAPKKLVEAFDMEGMRLACAMIGIEVPDPEDYISLFDAQSKIDAWARYRWADAMLAARTPPSDHGGMG